MGGRPATRGELTRADVGITTLDGHSRRLGNRGEGSLFSADFDFDGDRLAWWSYGCTSAYINVIDAEGPAFLQPPRAGCRLRFTRPPQVRARYVRLFVNCFGFAAGECTARRVVLTVSSGRRRTVIARGRTARRLTLTPAGRQRLMSRGVIRTRVSAIVADKSGRREARTGALTLRTDESSR